MQQWRNGCVSFDKITVLEQKSTYAGVIKWQQVASAEACATGAMVRVHGQA